MKVSMGMYTGAEGTARLPVRPRRWALPLRSLFNACVATRLFSRSLPSLASPQRAGGNVVAFGRHGRRQNLAFGNPRPEGTRPRLSCQSASHDHWRAE